MILDLYERYKIDFGMFDYSVQEYLTYNKEKGMFHSDNAISTMVYLLN